MAVKSGLFIIDIQGKLAEMVEHSDAMMQRVRVLIEAAKLMDLPIVVCEQMPQQLGHTHPTIAQDLEGAEILEKGYFNAMREPHIVNALSQAEHWCVVGIEAHICVFQTVCDMVEQGLNITVMADAVSSRGQGNIDVALDAMRAKNVAVGTSEMQIYQWLQRADIPQFKALLPSIKTFPTFNG